MTSIDPWFLYQLKEINDMQLEAEKHPMDSVPGEVVREAKRMGFSDGRLAGAWRLNGKGGQEKVRHLRKKFGVKPVYKRVDTCAAEFESYTPYLYSTYEEEDEATPTPKKKVIILGSGPNRIGQGIEFDYCCCHASFALREDGYETIMINCNPETVSTDYDTSDRLYFEPLTFEDVFAVYRARVLRRRGSRRDRAVRRADSAESGAAAQSRRRKDHRHHRRNPLIWPKTASASTNCSKNCKFRRLRAPWRPRLEEAVAGANRIGYPVLVRPSYVLGGRAMVIAYDEETVVHYMKEAVEYSQDRPVLIDHFLEDAIEVDVDALSDGEDVVIGGIMQHIEEAGIHSGDSSCVLPAVDIPKHLARPHARIHLQAGAGAESDRPDEHSIRHPAQSCRDGSIEPGQAGRSPAVERCGKVYVLEVNPRASRTVPYVSKATGVPMAKIAARLMTGRKLREFLPEFIAAANQILIPAAAIT